VKEELNNTETQKQEAEGGILKKSERKEPNLEPLRENCYCEHLQFSERETRINESHKKEKQQVRCFTDFFIHLKRLEERTAVLEKPL
jgi:hypothetical protein